MKYADVTLFIVFFVEFQCDHFAMTTWFSNLDPVLLKATRYTKLIKDARSLGLQNGIMQLLCFPWEFRPAIASTCGIYSWNSIKSINSGVVSCRFNSDFLDRWFWWLWSITTEICRNDGVRFQLPRVELRSFRVKSAFLAQGTFGLV
jgi:hypothetical protein